MIIKIKYLTSWYSQAIHSMTIPVIPVMQWRQPWRQFQLPKSRFPSEVCWFFIRYCLSYEAILLCNYRGQATNIDITVYFFGITLNKVCIHFITVLIRSLHTDNLAANWLSLMGCVSISLLSEYSQHEKKCSRHFSFALIRADSVICLKTRKSKHFEN